jgi:hypothetical protein
MGACGITLESKLFRQSGRQTVRHGCHQACRGRIASTTVTTRRALANISGMHFG